MQLTMEAQEHSNKPLKSLCVSEASGIRFICFQLAQPLEPMLKNYNIMFSTHQSDLFMKLWKSKLREISKSTAGLKFADFVTTIWDPVYKDCCQLVDSVKMKSIKLSDVDRYFGVYESYRGVRESLLSLYKACEACEGRSTNTGQWVRGAVDHMQQYWSLCEQAEAANTVLKLKDSLKLTGNFKTIEDVASRVTSSMKDAPLESIDQRLINARSFLEKFTSDRKKLVCLNNFADCMNIVEWMRKETKGQLWSTVICFFLWLQHLV